MVRVGSHGTWEVATARTVSDSGVKAGRKRCHRTGLSSPGGPQAWGQGEEADNRVVTTATKTLLSPEQLLLIWREEGEVESGTPSPTRRSNTLVFPPPKQREGVRNQEGI